ncbi:MAG: tRNA-dihydrouridine synthase, partial [Terriglobus sp.]
DAANMIAQTNCDAVMIGRAAPANPWIFRQIAQYTATKAATGTGTYTIATEQDRYRMIRTYFTMLFDELEQEHPEIDFTPLPTETMTPAQLSAYNHERNKVRDRESARRDVIGKMKQFASWFTHGVPGGATLRRSIFESKQAEQVMDAVDRFFSMDPAQRLQSTADLQPAAFADFQDS